MRKHQGSIFFPLLLITSGCVGLLINLGVLPPANLSGLIYVWPLWLIFLGLDIMIGYRARWLNAFIWLGAMGLTLFLLLYGPALGLLPQAEVKHEVLREPLNDVRAASISLDLPGNPVSVTALESPELLFEASISYIGNYTYNVYTTSNNEANIELSGGGLWSFFYIPSAYPEEDRWRIKLSPELPLKLDIACGAGQTELDLRLLTVRSLYVSTGSGAVSLILPEGGPQFKANLDVSSGAFTLNIPARAYADVRMDAGSGAVRIEVEPGAALRLVIESRGSGSLLIPSWLERVPDAADTWQTANFESASRRVVLTIEQGSGAIEIGP